MSDTAPDTKPAETPAAAPAVEQQQPETDKATFDQQPQAPKQRRGRTRKASTSSGASTPRRRSSSGTKKKRATKAELTKGVAVMYAQVGVALSWIPSPQAQGYQPGISVAQAVGVTIADGAQRCGEAWAALADENEYVREALEKMIGASAVGLMVTAHAPIAIAAMTAAGRLPEGMGPMLAAILADEPKQPTPQAAPAQPEQKAAA